jgi:hypothetical protein
VVTYVGKHAAIGAWFAISFGIQQELHKKIQES